MTRHYAYLHGFASGPSSKKGVAMAERFGARGERLLLPDLNRPSFSQLTISGAVEAVNEMVARTPETDRFCLIGSSMGGMVAARFAELHPGRVERLLLLCPGFDMPSRWRTLLSPAQYAAWQRDGELSYPDVRGIKTPVHWGLMTDALTHPPMPSVPCPTLIIHGTRDETVPIEVSRQYVAQNPGVRLIEVDDDHALMASLDRIEQEAFDFFGL